MGRYRDLWSPFQGLPNRAVANEGQATPLVSRHWAPLLTLGGLFYEPKVMSVALKNLPAMWRTGVENERGGYGEHQVTVIEPLRFVLPLSAHMLRV